jgi:hypothetical protein
VKFLDGFLYEENFMRRKKKVDCGMGRCRGRDSIGGPWRREGG